VQADRIRKRPASIKSLVAVAKERGEAHQNLVQRVAQAVAWTTYSRTNRFPRLAGEGLERLIEHDSAEERQAQEHAKGEPYEFPHGVPPSLCCLRFLA